MARFHRVLDVPHPPDMMYGLVDRIEDYPLYLPWCAGAAVDRGPGLEVRATLHLRRGALRHSFTTTNVHDPAARRIDVRLARGPLSSLQGQWRFLPAGDAGCRVEFDIDYQFANRILGAMLGPVFERVYGRMVEAFAARARTLQPALGQ